MPCPSEPYGASGSVRGAFWQFDFPRLRPLLDDLLQPARPLIGGQDVRDGAAHFEPRHKLAGQLGVDSSAWSLFGILISLAPSARTFTDWHNGEVSSIMPAGMRTTCAKNCRFSTNERNACQPQSPAIH